MKNVHVHVHGGLDQGHRRGAHAVVADDGEGIKRDHEGRFATSSGTGEQHAATAELHTSLAARKGTDHPHHAMHVAAAEAHTEAAMFLQQANKAQHPGAAIAAEHAAKKARVHENVINKGRGSNPGGEVKAQNKVMSDPRVLKENAERKAEFDEKNKGKAKGKGKTKDAADCGCGGHVTADVLFTDQSGEDMALSSKTQDGLATIRAFVGDDWAAWNAAHQHHTERASHHESEYKRKGVFHPDSSYHGAAQFHHEKAAAAFKSATGKQKANVWGVKGTPQQYADAGEHHAKEAKKLDDKLNPLHGVGPSGKGAEHKGKMPSLEVTRAAFAKQKREKEEREGDTRHAMQKDSMATIRAFVK